MALLLLMIFISTGCVQQHSADVNNAFLCDCSTYGIPSTWADSNQVACYEIPVDRKHASKGAGQFALAVVVAKAVGNKAELPLLYLHGGPGIATLDNVKRYLANPTWKYFREDRDLIFFDYRGTGHSDPVLCSTLQDSLQAFREAKPNEEDQQAKEILLYKNCKEALMTEGINLADFTSFQLAADAEAIRKALKIEEWDIYGVSYGTTIALNLIRSFPEQVHSAILDSPFPPNAPWNDFVRPFDTCFTVLEKSLKEDSLTAMQFSSIRNKFVHAVSRLNDKPAELADTVDEEVISNLYNGDDFAWSIWSAMLSPKTIQFVPLLIKEVADGNDSILQDWSTAFSSPDAYGKFSDAQSHAILCFEAKPQKEEDSEASLRKRYPDFTSFLSGYNTRLCEVWRPEIPDEAIFAPVVSDIPVLILSGQYDPVCPPLFGDIAAHSLSNARHIIVPAASHAVIHVDTCLRTMVADFLSDPHANPTTSCVDQQKKIEFVTADISKALKKFQK